MTECACKCHESHPSLHCLECAPAYPLSGDELTAAKRYQKPTVTLPLPDLTEMWALVFEEGVK